MKASFANIIDTEFIVTGLVEEQIYEFRVFARNAAGVSSGPSASTGEITAKDEVDPPKIDIDSKYSQAIVVNAGESFNIHADIYGKPVPTVHWLKGGEELSNAARLEIKNTDFTASLSVKEAIRVDGGQYILLLKNVGGEKSVTINVKVLDRPGPPDGPISIYGVTSEKCSISWKPPQQDGGSDVSHYIVERRETSRLVWTVVESKVQTLSLKITKLLPGNEYIFRVIPVNKYGIGEPLESDPVIATNPFISPSAPSDVEVSNITKDSMVITWERPTKDGGNPIQGFIVEKRDKEGVRWTRCNKRSVSELRFRVTGLLENRSYEFRVSAENAAGVGTASSPTEYYKALDPIFKPGPPNNPKVIDISRTSVVLAWGKPIYDGGCEVQAYIVEACEATSDEWIMCTPPTGITQTRFEIVKLLEKHEYKFRVCAVNKIGVGESADISGSYEFRVCAENIVGIGKYSKLSEGCVARDPCDPPGAPVPILVKRHSVKLRWTRPEYDGGSLVTGYIVEKRDLPDGRWMKASFANVIETEFLVEGLTEDCKYDFRVIAKNAAGAVSKPSESTGSITAKDEVEPPTYDIEAVYSQGIVVRAGGSMRINIPFKARPVPEIYWTKDDGDLPEKTQIEKDLDYTGLSIDICDRNDAGKYTLHLENSTGSKTAFVSVKVLDTPGPPLNLAVKDVTRNYVTLTWDPPLIDGGAKIKNYIVDKRDSTRKGFANVTTKCTKTSIRIGDLTEGGIYYFRVMGENEFGVGLPVETEEATKTADIPLAVGKVTLTDVTKTTASLSWEKPDFDGGSRILGYYIEMQPKGSDEWIVATTAKTCEGTVTGLSSGQEYLFRVSAFNEKGRSDPRPLIAPVLAKDVTVEPHFKITFSTYSVQAGEDLKIEIPLSGRPAPKITWAKEGQVLKETTRLNVSGTATSTVLRLKDASREDSGKYTVTATNSAGTITEEIGIIILDKPGPPVGPVKIEEVSANFVNISWEPPLYTGGCQINNYIVEKRDTTTTNWQIVSATIARTTIKITKLKTGSEYQFRVFAENRYGKSSSLDSATVIVQYPFSVPSAPGTPYVSSVTKDHMLIEWKPPSNNGVKDCIRVDGGHFVYKVTKLLPGNEYIFRVIAVNKYGIGEPLESDPVVARNPFKAPSPPSTPEASAITRDSIALTWERPEDDGGSLIDGYILEKRDKEGIRWTKC
uniref:Titin n=1 Tax=Denticeps clupeoides TaxID=299321 RepID=A0AAY4B5Q8_9TELE